jgi:hypothetical protein
MGATPPITGIASYDTAALNAETVRQGSQAAAQAAFANRYGPEPPLTEGAAMRAADIAYNKKCAALGIANGVSPVCFLTALQELGVNSMY